MKVYPLRDIRPFVMYCVNGKPRSSLLIESTDSMIVTEFEKGPYVGKNELEIQAHLFKHMIFSSKILLYYIRL